MRTYPHPPPFFSWLLIGYVIIALVLPLAAQASERQTVMVITTPDGGYLLRGEQHAVTVKKLDHELQVLYRAAPAWEILSAIAFGGRLHLDRLEQGVCLVNTGSTSVQVTVFDQTVTLSAGTSLDITGNQTQATLKNSTITHDIAARAASDVFVMALIEHDLFVRQGEAVGTLLETTYQQAFRDALQRGRSSQKAAQQAHERLAQSALEPTVLEAMLQLDSAIQPEIISAADTILHQPAVVQVAGEALTPGAIYTARASSQSIAQRGRLEPGQCGVVLADTGFRPAVNGFSFPNYGGEYPHGDLTTDDARLIFGDQACAGVNAAGCLTSPAAYVWVSRMNRVLKYGHCEGMAVLSALIFTGQEQPQQYGGQVAADLRPSRPTLIRAIGRYAAMQMLTPVWDEAAAFRTKSPADLVDIVTNALLKQQFYTMGLYSVTGAQTVLPYAVEDVGNGSLWVHVYDPNYPQEGKYVEFDPAANRWRYDGVEGGTGSIDLAAVATRRQSMSSPFAPSLSATMLLIDSQMADLAITTSDGKMMIVANGEIANQIPGAVITRLRGKEKLLPGERGASLSAQESAGTILPLLVNLPAGQEYLVSLSMAGELTAEELTIAPDDLKGKEKLLLEERGKEKLLQEQERGKEKVLLDEERGKEKLLQEQERGKEKVLLDEERGKEKLLQEEERGKEKVALDEERGKEKLLLDEERGAAGEVPTAKPIWMVVFQPNQAYLIDRIMLAPGTAEQLLLTKEGAVQYHAGIKQQLTVVAGSAVSGRANARYTIKKIALNPGYDFTIGQQPTTGQTWFRTTEPTLETLDVTIRVEQGRTSQRYAYPTLAAPLTGQHVVALQPDGRFQIGIDANLDGVPEEQIADADADGIPDGFVPEVAPPEIVPGAQGILVADTGFRPDQHGFSFENYAQNQYPYGDLTVDDAWRMFGDQVCETVKDGVCYPAPATQLWVAKMNASMQRGHCEGMAVLSMWLYTQEEAVPGFGGDQAYAMDPSYEALLRQIAYYWTTQTLEPVKSSYLAFREKTPTQILQTIIDAMQTKSETYTIGIYGRGGHAVTPYAVEDIGQGIFWVHVYDNNYPGVGKYIEIDTNAETWKYAGAALNPADDASPWEGGAGKIDLTPSSVRRQTLVCSFCQPKEKSQPKTVTVMVDGEGMQVSAKTAKGKSIRMENGHVINQIPGAQMTSIKGSGLIDDDALDGAAGSTIFGGDRATILTLPAGEDYTLSMTGDDSGDASAWVGVMMPGVMFAIDNLASGSGAMDQLVLSKEGMVEYIPGQVQRPTLSVATNTPGKPDALYTAVGGTLSPGGTLSIASDPETGSVMIASRDAGFSAASVSTTVVNGTTTETVIYDNLDLTGGIALAPTLDLPIIGTPEMPDDTQDMRAGFQEISESITSVSVPGLIEAPGDISVPGPGSGGNEEPQRVRIPVIIVPQ